MRFYHKILCYLLGHKWTPWKPFGIVKIRMCVRCGKGEITYADACDSLTIIGTIWHGSR